MCNETLRGSAELKFGQPSPFDECLTKNFAVSPTTEQKTRFPSHLPNAAKRSAQKTSGFELFATQSPRAVGLCRTACCWCAAAAAAVGALAGAEHACVAIFMHCGLRPLLRLLLLHQYVAPVRCTVERRHRSLTYSRAG
eukprot:gene16246-biopygen5485